MTALATGTLADAAEFEAERAAHDVILAWCRSKPRGLGLIGMREPIGGQFKGRCIVLDLEYTDNGKPLVHGDGASWVECLAALRAKGLCQ